jgi:NADH:ubiquinone oxidoreductase subunit 6 (subunit J)
MDAQTVGFFILAAITLGAALGTVIMRNIVHSALFLVLCFLGVAGIYILLEADFLFAIQILVYVGAVATLIIFGVMLTRGVRGEQPQNNNMIVPAVILTVILFAGILVPVILNTQWLASAEPAPQATTGILGIELMNGYALPFEIAGALLLVALVGAIIVARDK